MEILKEFRSFFLILTVIFAILMIYFISSPIAVFFATGYLVFLVCFRIFSFLKGHFQKKKDEEEIRKLLRK